MIVPVEYGYLIGDLVAMGIWLSLFFIRKDIRREMLIIGLIIGIMSVCTSYYWWTHDWWHPETITGTRVGIEDFFAGFFTGGIMAVIYEVVFKKQLYRSKKIETYPSAITILLFLALATSWLFWGLGLTSFWASSITMIITASVIYYYRKDLFINSVASGTLMVLVALPIYYAIILLTPGWVQATYNFHHLSGIEITGIPVEELVFWFLAGLIFGPFYEYWKGKRSRTRGK